jgi:hypothetical protein
VGGAGEDVVHRGRERAEQLAERALVLEVVAPPGPVVAGDRALDREAGARERDPVARRERQPERVRLDAAAGEQRRPDRQAHHGPGDRRGLQPALARHRVDQRAGCREQVRAVVEPVVAARIRPHPPAQPVLRLQQQDVAAAQPPRRRKPGDPAADHDHVVRHAAIIGARAGAR